MVFGKFSISSPGRYYSALSIIFLLAFILRVGITAHFQGLDSPPKFDAQPDQTDYELLAFHLTTGLGYALSAEHPTAHRPPGTSLTLFPIYKIFGRSYLFGRLWFCLLSALTCLATAWLAKQAYGPTVAIVAASLIAFYPGHFYYSMHFVSEVPGSLWLTLACAFTLRALNEGSLPFDSIAGVLWGAAILTRPQFISIVPIAWLVVLFIHKNQRGRNLSHLVVQTCCIIVLLTPWIVRNAIVVGKPTLSTVGGYTFWGAHNNIVLNDPKLVGSWIRTSDLVDEMHPLKGNEIDKEAAAWKYGLEFMRTNVKHIPKLIVMKIFRLLSPYTNTPNKIVFYLFAIGWFVVCPLIFIGFPLAFKKNITCAVVLLIPIISVVNTAIVFYGSERFRDLISPIFVIPAAIATLNLSRMLFRIKTLTPGTPYSVAGAPGGQLQSDVDETSTLKR